MTSRQRPPGEEGEPRPEVSLTPEQAARLDPDVLYAMRLEPSTAAMSSTTGRRGCRVMVLLIGVGAFVGIAILSVMLGQLRSTSGGTSDTRAKNTLTTTVSAAQGIAGATTSFVGAGPAALQPAVPNATYVEGTQASTSNTTVSVRHEPGFFIATTAGTSGTCWFIRATTDPAMPGATWNRTTSTPNCIANAAPIDGWTAEPPT